MGRIRALDDATFNGPIGSMVEDAVNWVSKGDGGFIGDRHERDRGCLVEDDRRTDGHIGDARGDRSVARGGKHCLAQQFDPMTVPNSGWPPGRR